MALTVLICWAAVRKVFSAGLGAGVGGAGLTEGGAGVSSHGGASPKREAVVGLGGGGGGRRSLELRAVFRPLPTCVFLLSSPFDESVPECYCFIFLPQFNRLS